MSRNRRTPSSNGIYHVMLRGVNRQRIFECNDDYMKFIMILHDMIAPHDQLKGALPPRCAFYTYCLMPNHVHLLLQERDESISTTVKRIASRYAMYYNNCPECPLLEVALDSAEDGDDCRGSHKSVCLELHEVRRVGKHLFQFFRIIPLEIVVVFEVVTRVVLVVVQH